MGPGEDVGSAPRGRSPRAPVCQVGPHTRACPLGMAAGDGRAGTTCPQRAGHSAGVQTSSTEVSPFCLEASPFPQPLLVQQSLRAHPSLQRCTGFPRPAVQPHPSPGQPRGCQPCALRKLLLAARKACLSAAPRCAPAFGLRSAGPREASFPPTREDARRKRSWPGWGLPRPGEGVQQVNRRGQGQGLWG